MFAKSPIQVKLDEVILLELKKLERSGTTPEERATAIEHMSKLHKLKVEERPKQISPDIVLSVVANIFGILWITRYERERIINSKALGFVLKPRS